MFIFLHSYFFFFFLFSLQLCNVCRNRSGPALHVRTYLSVLVRHSLRACPQQVIFIWVHLWACWVAWKMETNNREKDATHKNRMLNKTREKKYFFFPYSFLIPAKLKKRKRPWGDWNSSGRFLFVCYHFSVSLSELTNILKGERKKKKICDVSGTSPGQREEESARAHTHAGSS